VGGEVISITGDTIRFALFVAFLAVAMIGGCVAGRALYGAEPCPSSFPEAIQPAPVGASQAAPPLFPRPVLLERKDGLTAPEPPAAGSYQTIRGRFGRLRYVWTETPGGARGSFSPVPSVKDSPREPRPARVETPGVGPSAAAEAKASPSGPPPSQPVGASSHALLGAGWRVPPCAGGT
jgi:hypothetical protein